MAERLRGLTVVMVFGYIIYEFVTFLLANGGLQVPFIMGVGLFFVFGAALGYKAYEESATSGEMVEAAITFIVILAILSFLAAVFLFMISSLGKYFLEGVDIGNIASQAGASLLEYDNFMRIMALLLGFVGGWFVMRQSQNTPQY